MSKMTNKQLMFCKEYLVDLNGTQAAIRAGYSKKTACAIGAENLRKPQIRAEILKNMQKRAENTEISSEYVINNIKEIGERCMQRVKVMVRDGKRMVQKQEFNDDGELVGVWEFKEMGALKANELLGKHLKLFTEKVEHTGKDGAPIEVDTTDWTAEQFARAIADELKK